MTALLEVSGLEAGYGKSQVLFGMGLQVQPGRCTTLLGRNGMGKSTTIKSVMGLVKPTGGEVRWKGQTIQGKPPYAVARLGLGLVPEGRQIFPNLTVRENLVATARQHGSSKSPWTVQRVHQVFPRLAERARNFGNQLSGGEQQMLAIGRALLTNPELLILDEATEGLSPLIRQEIWAALAQIKSEGMAILVVDKNLVPLLALADHHYVVEKGQVAWSGSSVELRNDRTVLQRYLSAGGGDEDTSATPALPLDVSAPAEAGGEPTLLETLYVEHRTITAVLDTMAALLRGTTGDRQPLPTAPLHAILHYLDVFPERHHHPKEEEYLFPAIRSRTREADAVLDRLQRQHVKGDEALRALQQKLTRAEMGGAAELPVFLQAASEFIVRYREHLRIEEVELMPIARRVLPRSEWALIEQQFRERPDPLQADAGALDAQALLRRITALAPAPLGYGPAAH
jgi:branched-chain amino acid transport system ATP-binding protein